MQNEIIKKTKNNKYETKVQFHTRILEKSFRQKCNTYIYIYTNLRSIFGHENNHFNKKKVFQCNSQYITIV